VFARAGKTDLPSSRAKWQGNAGPSKTDEEEGASARGLARPHRRSPHVAAHLASERRIAFSQRGIYRYFKELDG
jgi:hypothetical protein